MSYFTSLCSHEKDIAAIRLNALLYLLSYLLTVN